MTQRDGMGREEGEGFRMGNTCMPVSDSFQYMAKPIQYCKFKKKKKATCQFRRCKRHRFDPWVQKITWRGKMATHSNILA